MVIRGLISITIENLLMRKLYIRPFTLKAPPKKATEFINSILWFNQALMK